MNGPLRVRNLQVDAPADRFDTVVSWWAEALGGTPRAADGPFIHLDGVRARVGVHVQRLDGGSAGYHLDLEADDRDAEVARLVSLGAARVGEGGPDEEAVVLADPAGLRFCVTEPGQEQHLSDERELAHVRVLMFDAPADVADAEASFWAAALGGRAVPVGDRYPEYTWVHDVTGPGGPINIAVQALHEGDARLHVDLHCATGAIRDAEVARLTAGGATLVAETNHWRVLTDPAGNHCCVVPDAPGEG